MNENLYLILIIVAAVMIVLDLIISPHFDWSESLSNVAAWALTLSVGSLAIPLVTPLYHWAYAQTLLQFDNTHLLAILAATLLYDFLYYWYHRISHSFGVLWNVHAVHHQATVLTPSLGLKSSVLDFAAICLVTIPMVLIGFGSQSLIIALGIHGLYQLFLHNQWSFNLGVFEKILNTPNHHTLHHATNKEYLDKNFGSILIIWDKLFGTFAKQKQKPKIGIHGGNYARDPILSNVMPWFSNRFKLQYKGYSAYLLWVSYLFAFMLILVWLFSESKNSGLLYSVPALLISHTILQQWIVKKSQHSE